MKRLLLASSGLGYLKDFVKDDPSDVSMLFIPTASNLDREVWWIDKDREVLSKMGFPITELDIETASISEQRERLDSADIVYVAGGNTFHLLNQLRKSGFDELLTEFVNKGGMYAGASAGALVAGADIGPIRSIDEPEKVKDLTSTKGLGFVNIVPVPHYDMTGRTKPIDEIKRRYGDKNELVLLTDDQAIVVEGDSWEVVESPRSRLEHSWFDKSH